MTLTKLDKEKKLSIKFLILILFIATLFPPYEWDSSSLSKGDYVNLPIKKYDFLFSDNVRLLEVEPHYWCPLHRKVIIYEFLATIFLCVLLSSSLYLILIYKNKNR